MDYVTIRYIKKKPKLNNPILIEGLPGIGNVGKLAVEHLIDSINAKKFAEWLGLRMIDGDELSLIFHHYRIGFSRTETNVDFKKGLFKKKINKIVKEIELMSRE